MDEKNIVLKELIENGLGYIWLMVLALWGGTVNYLSRLKQGKVHVFSFVELVGEWTISGFAGILTTFICLELQFSWYWTAFLTAISGHLGGRAIFMFEKYFQNTFTKHNLK